MNSEIEILQSAAATVAVARLIYFRLGGNLPAVLSYLVLLAVSNFIYALLPLTSAAYFWVYVAEAPLECLFSILVARELFALVFERYRGIVTAGRWAMYTGLGVACVLSTTITRAFWNGGAHGRSGIFYFEVVQRSVVFSLVVVLLTILFVVSRYPLRLMRNIYVCAGFFSALLLSDAARLLADSLAPHLHDTSIDAIEAVIISACLVGWGMSLQREDASARVPEGPVANADTQVLRQLATLNDMLVKAGRR